MLIIGQWLDHNWLLEIILFVKASRRSREANHLLHSETESVCLWCMKCDCQGTNAYTHPSADTHRRVHKHTHTHTHTEAGNWAHKAKGQEQQNLPSCLCVQVFKCVSEQAVFLCCSSNALAYSYPPKTRQFPVRPAECDSSRCLMGKA